MKLVTPRDHKFAALHGAVWSGGSFVYVPKGVQVSIPLQSYFRLNAKGAGQFEHTLIIVDEGASLHFIEGCSAPKYNVANLHAGCVELFVKKMPSSDIPLLKTGLKICITLTPSVRWLKRAALSSGFRVRSAHMSAAFIP